MKRAREEIQKIVENLGYELLDEYSDESHHRMVIVQDSDGYKYEVLLKNLTRNIPPDFVGKNNPFTLPNISLWLKIENKPFILCEGNIYEAAHKKLFFQCLRESCQEVFDMSWGNIYHNHHCPFCVGQRVGKRNNLAYRKPDLVKEWDYEKNEKNPENYSEFTKEEVSWICSKCGHKWDTKIINRSNGTGCPKCYDLQKESTIANKLKEYFKENYDAEDEYKILKNPDTGYWLPFDIYIPYGENPDISGFYIEVHWEQHYKVCYFHKLSAKKNGTTPEEEFEYQKYKDKIKKTFAKKNGIYVEVDLRKIKTDEEAIGYIESILKINR